MQEAEGPYRAGSGLAAKGGGVKANITLEGIVMIQLDYFLICLLLLLSLLILFFLHLSLIFDFIDFDVDLIYILSPD